MSRIKQFKLPDLGEGLTEGEILQWLVKPGDEVKLNQPIVEVETAKAAVEIPSPYAGVVSELFCGEGDTVEVGTPIIAYDTEPGAGPAPTSSAAPTTDAVASSAKPRSAFHLPSPNSSSGWPAASGVLNRRATRAARGGAGAGHIPVRITITLL